MNTLTTKLMSATLGLALVLGVSIAGGIATAGDASARTLSRSKIVSGGQKRTERPKIDFDRVKKVKPVERERLIDAGGSKADLVKRLREKKVPGRG
jgi:hypothetical protein